MTRALIIGISGFVGKHLQEHLLNKRWQVHGFDMRSSDAKVFIGNLSDHATLAHAIVESQPDVIFHLAGIIKSGDSESYYKSNLFGTLNLLDTVVKMETRPKVVIASSSAVYGLTKGAQPVTERSALHPVTEYAVSKVAQEMAGLRYYYAFGLPITVVRMFNLLGPGQSSDLACSAFARQIALAEITDQTEIVTGNLDARRDFVDARDAVRAFRMLAEKGQPGQIYNVCSGRAVTIQKCLHEMMSQSKKKLAARVDAVRIQKNDVPVQIGSYQKLHKVTGWSPKISLKQSLSDLLNDWRRRVKEAES
jgi:GDP-4-dehydro-6-deoxy-D-mannose reductase